MRDDAEADELRGMVEALCDLYERRGDYEPEAHRLAVAAQRIDLDRAISDLTGPSMTSWGEWL